MGCGALAAALGSLPALAQLDLSDNPLGDGGVRELCTALAGPGCSLQKLWYGASGWRVRLCCREVFLGCAQGPAPRHPPRAALMKEPDRIPGLEKQRVMFWREAAAVADPG